MNVVTDAMRGQRRARRDAERARRGAPPRRRFAPRPAGLIRDGWSPTRVTPPPESAAGPRLLGATAPAVLIAGRALVRVGSREVTATVLPLPPATTGPMPASVFSVATVTTRPATGAPAAGRPTTEAPAPVPAAAAVATPSATPAPAAAPASAPVPTPTPAPTAATPVPGPATTEAPVVAAAMAMTGAPPTAPPAGPAVPAARVAADPVVPSPPSGHTSPREPSPSDLFAHALGLSPANSPAPPTVPRAPADRPSRRSRPKPTRYYEPQRRMRLVLAAVGVVVLAGAGTAAGIAIANRPGDVGTTTVSNAPLSVSGDVASWLTNNVDSGLRIVSTDADLVRDLNANGVAVDTVSSVDDARVGVVVVATDAPDPAPTVVAAGTSLTVVTLALFEEGGERVTVGQAVQGGAEQVRADLDKSAATAMAACKGLQTNAAVRIDPTVAPLFAAGGLDLRASTLLALLAQDQQIEVVAAPQDPSEKLAGRAVRTLVIKAGDQAAVRDTAASARAPYSPDVKDADASDGAPAGSLVLSWPTDAAATLPLS